MESYYQLSDSELEAIDGWSLNVIAPFFPSPIQVERRSVRDNGESMKWLCLICQECHILLINGFQVDSQLRRRNARPPGT